MSKNAEFERCADFLARMIEKYGDQVILPKTAEKTKDKKDIKDNDNKTNVRTDTSEKGCLSA